MTEPWNTLPALVGIVTLILLAWRVRARWPLFSLGVLFFFVGHLLESTTLPLELYFEHRNYLPAVFLFLPAAGAVYRLWTRPKKRLARVLTVLSASIYAGATWQHASLWGDEDQLLLVWAKMNPSSVRAQVSASQTWLRNNEPEKALATLETARKQAPDNALVTASWLAVRADLGLLTLAELEEGARNIRAGRFDAQAVRALERLVQLVNRAPNPEAARFIDALLQGIRTDLDGSIPPVHRMTFYLQGILQAGQGHPDAALEQMLRALELYNSVDAGLRMVSDLAILGHAPQALILLARCETLLMDTSDADLSVSRGTYERDIARIKAALLEAAGYSISPNHGDDAL